MRILVVALLVFLAACEDRATATRVLEGMGMSNIEFVVRADAGFRCGEGLYFTGFKATGPTGKPLSGVVCGGYLKNSTVRFD